MTPWFLSKSRKSFAIFTRKPLRRSLFLTKLRSSDRVFQRILRNFPVNIVKNSFLIEHLRTPLVALSETSSISPDDKKLIMNNNWDKNNNNKQQPVAVTKELNSKIENKNILCNLWLLLFPYLINQRR